MYLTMLNILHICRAIQKTNCHHDDPSSLCKASTTTYIAIYGVIQIFLSQIPNFGELWWLSYLAAVMSITYSCIAAGLGFATVATKTSNDFGSLYGVPIKGSSPGPSPPGSVTEAQKVWDIFIALGNIAFAYAFSSILIEIQDTIRSPPAENKQMKRATLIGICTTTLFYLSVGVAGYAAFGDQVCGDILTCFDTPYWLVDAANTCVIVHLVGAYQV
jgi:amino acid permease